MKKMLANLQTRAPETAHLQAPAYRKCGNSSNRSFNRLIHIHRISMEISATSIVQQALLTVACLRLETKLFYEICPPFPTVGAVVW